MKNLCVFTLYSEKGASSQYRIFIFKNKLEEKFNVKWYSFWNDKYVTTYMHNKKKYMFHIALQYIIAYFKRWYQLNFIASKCDIVFIQKASIPKAKYTYLNRIKKKVKIVFDVDDAIYVTPKDNSTKIASQADCVICGNSNLKDFYSKYNNKCILIPTVDNTIKYMSFWKDTFDKKIIGWIGSQTTIDNFDVIVDALNYITARHSEVKIAIISNSTQDYLSKINNSYFIPWKVENYIEEIGNFTIGIMPLKNNEINRGKCGFKLIQCLNMKKPVVGSGVGVNQEIIMGNGIVADTTEEWISALEKILYDKTFYNECIKHIEDVFFKDYHYLNVEKKLLAVLNES